MNGFISHILKRHLQPESNIMPRIPGRFESFTSTKLSPDEIDADKSNAYNEAQTQNHNEGSFQKSTFGDEEKHNSFSQTSKNALNEIDNDLNKNSFETKRDANISVDRNSTNGDDKGQVSDISLITHGNLIDGEERSHLIDTEYRYLPDVDRKPFEEKEITPNQKNDRGPLIFYPQKRQGLIINNHYGIEENIQQTTPPAIKVSIGRIEVRAIVSSAPEKKNTISSQKPDMTLDDYLKKRNNK